MMPYELLKAGHLVAVVIWFGGMMSAALVLTRGSGETIARFGAWDRSVTTPAMVATWALGLTLAVWGNWFASGWMGAKLVFVLVLSAVHGILSGRLRRAAADGEAAAGTAVRIALPAMTVSLCAIVLLVVTKAF
jgi:uncharacterized membrane protein